MKQQQNSGMNAKSFAWNTIGSIISAASSFILLSCVTRAVGADNAGIFAFSFSSAQLLLTLGKFGVRSYQATDVTKQITAASYFVLRILSCAAMMLSCVAMIAMLGYHGADAGVVLAVCAMKMVDAVEDVYHGQLQLNLRMDVAGKLLALRNAVTMVLFAVLIFLTKDIGLTAWVTAGVSLVLCLAVNHPALNRCEPFRLKWNAKEIGTLTMACLPLFIGHFLSLYIYNVPKYAIEVYCEPQIQTFYNILFMPAFAINLMSEFIFKPMLTDLALWWEEKQYKKFDGMIVKMVVFIFVITAVILVGTYFLGAPLLSAFFGEDVRPYRTELMFLMLGGGFGAVVYFLYNVLTSMRKQGFVLFNYAVSAVIVTAIAFVTVGKHGMLAAALSYVFAEVALCLLMIGSVVLCSRRQQKKGGDESHESRNCDLSGNE
ncbi:MAG: lipopolysaccharide biosynthesis protein [Ruminococcaceae bacterium]|nr:lipopolysaccharide biosynthesis protein [Oscillospiraceae bacterium]